MGISLWSDNQIEAAIAVLRGHRRVVDALPEIAGAVGRSVTTDSLKHAFKARKLGAPSDWLAGRVTDRAQLSKSPSGGVYDSAKEAGDSRESSTDYGKVNGTARVLVCPDAHHPFVDPLAWSTFLAAAREWRPDVLVIIGDFVDSYSISSHAKDPERKVNFRDEINAANAALDEIDSLRVPRVVFCEGNHETRLARAIAERAPEFHGLIDIRDLLRIHQRGYEWVPYKQLIRIGKIAFTHDVERCGVNAARQSLIDMGGNLVFGHTHRGAVVYAGTVEGDQHVCMNVGWLGSFDDIDYKHQARARREWQHGFGLVTLDATGCGWCEFVPILSGRCIVDGRVVSGRMAA